MTAVMAYLPDFGGRTGMVVGPIRQDSVERDIRRLAATHAGVYFSRLADKYRSLDRESFIDTLNDWGWFGPERRSQGGARERPGRE